LVDRDVVKKRIQQLIAGGEQFNNGPAAAGWLIAAYHAVTSVCAPGTAYASEAKRIMDSQKGTVSWRAENMHATLIRLLEDIELGLLASIENSAIAVTFDKFLDHGMEYLNQGRKNEAAVIAGIVFEDTVRRLCRTRTINENGIKLDTLITQLVNANVLTALKAKRARAAAALRTSAAHARWDDFTLEDVRPAIEMTREVIASHLESAS
jgi:hypothetical protein